MRNKGKSIYARVIIRFYGREKITKETVKIIIKSACRCNNQTKFTKCITKGKLVHFRSTIETNRGRTRRIQFVIHTFVKNAFCFNLHKNFAVKLHVSISDLHWAFRIHQAFWSIIFNVSDTNYRHLLLS